MLGRHLSTPFDAELGVVSDRLMQMGGLVESQVKRAVYALMQYSGEVAAEVLAGEDRVNRMEVEIDSDLTSIIARRQPTAGDLRLLIAISKAVGNLERVGDEAAKIARTVQRLVNTGATRQLRLPTGELGFAAGLATTSLRNALDAFALLDARAAVTVIETDASIDVEFDGLMRKLACFMSESPGAISASIDLVFVAKAIERVGDHAKNLAEQAIYVVKGADVRHSDVGTVATLIADE